MTAFTERSATPPDGVKIIAALLQGCTHVLDLGCGERHHTKHLANSVWVDIDPCHATDPKVIVMGIREAPNAFRRMHFDAVLMTDVIEHLDRDSGEKLLSEVSAMADRIIVFTPLGSLWVREESKSPHDHRSGWMPSDFPGYNIWQWDHFHCFENQNTHGAFFAWKFNTGVTPTPEEISQLSTIPI